MLSRSGDIFRFGEAADMPTVSGPAVSITASSGQGVWVLAEDGTVSAVGEARAFGNVDVSAFAPDEAVSSVSSTPDGQGYWVFTDRGRAVAFGNAEHYGDAWTIGIAESLVGPIIASVPTPSGKGYYMLGSDGGVFTFGDAVFAGSVPQLVPVDQLAAPLAGLAPDPDGIGYWLLAGDGGLFSFEADFRGSVPGVLPPGTQLVEPVIGGIAFEGGYLMVASDGGIFNFSPREFRGSLGFSPPSDGIVGVAALKARPVVDGDWHAYTSTVDGEGNIAFPTNGVVYSVTEAEDDRSLTVSLTSEACRGKKEVGTIDFITANFGVLWGGSTTMIAGDCGNEVALTIAFADTSGSLLTICTSRLDRPPDLADCQVLDRPQPDAREFAIPQHQGLADPLVGNASSEFNTILSELSNASRRASRRSTAFREIENSLGMLFGPALATANFPVAVINSPLTPAAHALAVWKAAIQAAILMNQANDVIGIPAPTPEAQAFLDLTAYRLAMIAAARLCLPLHTAAPTIGVNPWLACVSFPNGELVRTAFLVGPAQIAAQQSLEVQP